MRDRVKKLIVVALPHTFCSMPHSARESLRVSGEICRQFEPRLVLRAGGGWSSQSIREFRRGYGSHLSPVFSDRLCFDELRQRITAEKKKLAEWRGMTPFQILAAIESKQCFSIEVVATLMKFFDLVEPERAALLFPSWPAADLLARQFALTANQPVPELEPGSIVVFQQFDADDETWVGVEQILAPKKATPRA